MFFWKKLDFSPAYIIPEEKIDVLKEMKKVTKHILVQPETVQKSLLKRITSIIFLPKPIKKPLKVETNTRGRPRKQKTQETSVDPPRHSSVSFVPERQHTPVPSRHSVSVVGSQSSDPSHQHNSVSSKIKGKNVKYSFTLGDEHENNKKDYLGRIPDLFHPFC